MSNVDRSSRPVLVLVGGFLGAGKTSLIMAASRVLANRGIRCAAILNDQGEELVDTRQIELHGTLAEEITGGCFCCRFSKLRESIGRLRHAAPQVIFAEPVGSCTDLVATVLNPLRQEFNLCRIAPFTVLVDPLRAEQMQKSSTDPHMLFLWKKQLEEADLVCATKSDRYPIQDSLPHALGISSRTGEGVAAWLDLVLGAGRTAGQHTLDIDYGQYAAAEAALSWTNLSVHLELQSPLSPSMLVGPLLDDLERTLTCQHIAIVHLKLIDTAPSGWLKAAICAPGEEPVVEGDLDASPASEHDLLLNLRAVGDPARVRSIFKRILEQIDAKFHNFRMDCFSPQPPRPERRISELAAN